MADLNYVAQKFTEFYYIIFKKDRKELRELYRDTSMLCFEGSAFLGVDNIIKKLTELPFQTVDHHITTCDVLPAAVEGSLSVLVTGFLTVDGGSNPLQFSQVFQLNPEGGTFYVFSDIFRFNIG